MGRSAQMSMLSKIIEKSVTAIVTRRQISRFNCEGCDLRDYCSLPAEKRQLCWEARAFRPR
jgi:hypothetical protein